MEISQNNSQSSGEGNIYPTAPNADGFYYDNAGDELNGVATRRYENGSKVKSVVLPECGKTAVIRSLKAKDTKEIARFMNKDPEAYMMAAVTVAVTLNGEKQPIEVIAELPLKDYNLLMEMNGDLNF